jgi:small subunit ribosomal protein S9
MIDEEPPDERAKETPAPESPPRDAPRDSAAEASTAGEVPSRIGAEDPAAAEASTPAEEPPTVEQPGATEASAAAPEPAAAVEQPAAAPEPAAAVEQPSAAPEPGAADEPGAAAPPPAPVPPAPGAREAKPAIPGADLEVDIVPEGSDPLAREQALGEFEEDVLAAEPAPEEAPEAPAAAEAKLPRAAIDLAAGAQYIATGKRKTAVARVILKPGAGEYTINGKGLNDHFPRHTAQRNIRQPLETVGYEARMDVVAKLHGGGISAQAGALRHGIARALIEADPNLRIELKRRGFLTRDSRVKERRKAGLKKARKRPQFSKR